MAEVEDPKPIERAKQVDAMAIVLTERIKSAILPTLAPGGEGAALREADRVVLVTVALAQMVGSLWGAFENDDKLVSLFWDVATQTAKTAQAEYAELVARKTQRG